jgi:uncharacterized protein (TIGR00730 family)
MVLCWFFRSEEEVERAMARVRSLCVFCGSSSRVDPGYLAAAARLGRLAAVGGVRVVNGGGRVGMMGAVSDAALAAGGEVVGVIPRHLMRRELGHHGLTQLHVVDGMHSRKQMMFELADAFAALPGGVGTLDETFEVITWKQLGLHDKPIVVVNQDGYWDRLAAVIEGMVEVGFATAATAGLFAFVPAVEEVFPALARAPEPALSPDTARL